MRSIDTVITHPTLMTSMELDSKVYVAGTLVGILLMLGSFISYVITPSNPMVLLFVIGFVLLVLGYLLTYRENRGLIRQYETCQRVEDENGFLLALDEDYVPYDNPATIEDLRE